MTTYSKPWLLSSALLPPSNLLITKPMQMLHMKPASRPTATIAHDELCSNKLGPSWPCSVDPYLHRVCWVLMNKQGQYLAAVDNGIMQFVHDANKVPPQHRFATYERAKSVCLQLSSLLPKQDRSLAIQSVDFYASRSMPTTWSARND
mgnify:CR=1 FL=1